jgi:hypothetical protein
MLLMGTMVSVMVMVISAAMLGLLMLGRSRRMRSRLQFFVLLLLLSSGSLLLWSRLRARSSFIVTVDCR